VRGTLLPYDTIVTDVDDRFVFSERTEWITESHVPITVNHSGSPAGAG
jgi:hypothetical protein